MFWHFHSIIVAYFHSRSLLSFFRTGTICSFAESEFAVVQAKFLGFIFIGIFSARWLEEVFWAAQTRFFANGCKDRSNVSIGFVSTTTILPLILIYISLPCLRLYSLCSDSKISFAVLVFHNFLTSKSANYPIRCTGTPQCFVQSCMIVWTALQLMMLFHFWSLLVFIAE